MSEHEQETEEVITNESPSFYFINSFLEEYDSHYTNLNVFASDLNLLQNSELKEHFSTEGMEIFNEFIQNLNIKEMLIEGSDIENKQETYLSFIFVVPRTNKFHDLTEKRFQQKEELKKLFKEADKINSKPIPKVNIKNLKVSAIFFEVRKVATKMAKEKMTETLNDYGLESEDMKKARQLYKNRKNLKGMVVKGMKSTWKKAKKEIKKDINQKISEETHGLLSLDGVNTEQLNLLKTEKLNMLNTEKLGLIENEEVKENSNLNVKNEEGEVKNIENLVPPVENKSLFERIFGNIRIPFFSKKEEEIKPEEKEIIHSNQDYRNILTNLFNKLSNINKLILNESILPLYENKISEVEEAINMSQEEKDIRCFFIFISYFTGIICFFTKLHCKMFIDETENLNIEYYLDQEKIVYLASSIRYNLNYRISTKGKISKDYTLMENVLSQENIIELNKIERENYFNKSKISQTQDFENGELSNLTYYDNVMYHPPYDEFKSDASYINFYRRYDSSDDLHLCEKCFFIKEHDQKPDCSDIFRYIDKARITSIELNNVLSITTLSESIVKEEYENSSILKRALVHHNYEGFNMSTMDIFYACLNLNKNKSVDRMLRKFRNLFGEELAFYFVWVSHFIQFLIYPAMFGIIITILSFIIQFMISEESYFLYNIDLVLKLPFTFFIFIWAKAYIDSWTKMEAFYCYQWGMEDYCVENYELEGTKKFEKFLNIKIPIQNEFIKNLKKMVSWTITIFMLFVVILSNKGVFMFQGFLNNNFKDVIKEYSLAPYLYPFSLFLVRQINTSLFTNISEALTDWETHNTVTEKRESLIIKSIAFQFFNYYFNLYYIVFIKNSAKDCLQNNCKIELETQVTVLLISAILNDLICIIYLQFFSTRSIREKINQITASSSVSNNPNSKFNYYTKRIYDETNADKEYIEVTLSFGYVIQFGGSSPICFFLCLIQALLARLSDALRLGKFDHVNFSSGSKGIGSHAKIISFMVTMGIISNLVINLITDSRMSIYDLSSKYSIIIVVENILFVALMFSEIEKLPLWFNFKNQLKTSYSSYLKLFYQNN